MVTFLTDMAFEADPPSLRQRLRIRQGSREASWFAALLAEAQQTGRPKALYRPAYVEEWTEEAVKVDGRWLHSRVLSVNLRKVQRLFLYLATCGVELEEWARKKKDSLKTYYWVQAIKEAALEQAVKVLQRHIEATFRPGRLSHQSPGSLKDFPLKEQETLFQLLGQAPAAVGVTLLPGLVMTPAHTVSGILFPTEEEFYSCLLCDREKCPRRRAPYDPTLYARKYARP
jgi:hypothetical protein